MINTKLEARTTNGNEIKLFNTDKDCVATFSSIQFFYIVTGYKTVEAYNENQNEAPVKFLLWKREH